MSTSLTGLLASATNTVLPPVNSTLFSAIAPTKLSYPIYYTPETSILPFISDKVLSLLSPLICYWSLSMVFHLLDVLQLPYFEARKIHPSSDALIRNRATVSQVVKAVLLQQCLQTILGFLWLEDEETILRREVYKDHLAAMQGLASGIARMTVVLLGERTGASVLKLLGAEFVQWMYWWGIPIMQMWFAFFCLDTHQFLIHKYMHTNKWLYRNVHSVHHDLIVVHAFGALYNNWLEGFLLDTLGAAIAHSAAQMTVRQAIFLFSVSTLKTVDDHSGYRLAWDPFQYFFANNSDYHDIHHMPLGQRHNYSQPFFTNWDILMGTRMTRVEYETRSSRLQKLKSKKRGTPNPGEFTVENEKRKQSLSESETESIDSEEVKLRSQPGSEKDNETLAVAASKETTVISASSIQPATTTAGKRGRASSTASVKSRVVLRSNME